MPSSHLILCRPLLLLPPVPPSIRDFSNESALCIRWPKYWSFSFNISPSNELPGLISFRMDWLDVLAVQGTWTCLETSPGQFFYFFWWPLVYFSIPWKSQDTVTLTRGAVEPSPSKPGLQSASPCLHLGLERDSLWPGTWLSRQPRKGVSSAFVS